MRLHVEDAGDGPAIVLTHGLGDDARTWDAVADRLRRTHRVVAWDLRGHGRSDAPSSPDAYSREVAVADLAGIVDRVDAPVTLVGHSLGGYLSLFLALQHPELVGALVLVSSGPGFRSERSRAEWNAYVDRVAADMAIGRHAARLCHQHDAWAIDNVGALQPPLLQLVGERDVRFHAGVAHLERAVAGSRVLTIPDAGHHPQRLTPTRWPPPSTTTSRDEPRPPSVRARSSWAGSTRGRGRRRWRRMPCRRTPDRRDRRSGGTGSAVGQASRAGVAAETLTIVPASIP